MSGLLGYSPLGPSSLGTNKIDKGTKRRRHVFAAVVVEEWPGKRFLPFRQDLHKYGVLSRGLISGHWQPSQGNVAGDFRSHGPRFQGDNEARNLALAEALSKVATAKGMTTAQAAIAWVMAQGDDICR